MKSLVAARAVLAAAVLSPLAACAPTILAAHNSVNPVLLGPVKALRNANVPLEPAGSFATQTQTLKSAAGDATSAHSSSYQTAATEADWAVVSATSGDPRRTIHLDSVQCGGWVFYPLLAMISRLTCEAHGTVFEPPPGVTSIVAVRRGPPAPAPPVAAVPPPPPPVMNAPGAADDGTGPAALVPAQQSVVAPTPPAAPPPRRRSNFVPPPPPPILR